MNFIKKHKYKIFLLSTFIIYTLSFSTNILKVTDSNFKFFDRVDELMVVSRLHVSQQESPFAHAAMVGTYQYDSYLESDGTITQREVVYEEPDKIDSNAMTSLSYDDYLEARTPHDAEFGSYMSHPGGHAFMYSLIQEILPVKNNVRLFIFRLITIMLSALVFSLFTTWLYRNFSLTVATTTFILTLFIPIIILLSYNLWWALWSFYIPFITITLVLENRQKKETKMFDNKLLLYVLITCFLKFFFTGFEFITSSLVMAICPIIYYMILEKHNTKEGFVYFAKSSLAALSGTLLGVLYLITQARFYGGSWTCGLEQILDAFSRRSVYNEDLSENSISQVLEIFGIREVFRLDYNTDFTINYITLVIVITLLCVILYYFRNKIQEMREWKNISLLAITTISILGPLSWIIIFTQHAMYHSLDIIIMYMPYCLYGFAVIGLSLDIAFKKTRSVLRQK